MKSSHIVAGVAILIAVAALVRDFTNVVTKTVTQIIEVTPQELLDERLHLRQTATGLRARIRGLETRVPVVVLRTDTIISPPDTVFETVVLSAAGTLTISTLNLREQTAEVQQDIPVGDCDDGFVIQASGVICNKALLGHLYLFGSASSQYGIAGAYWEPSYRSTFRISAGYTTDARIELRVTKALRIF